MPDREKVIGHLNDCMGASRRDNTWVFVRKDIVEDALALLKGQDAVEPTKMQRMDGNFSFFVPYYLCGNCRYELVGKDVMFCSHCGRPVQYE